MPLECYKVLLWNTTYFLCWKETKREKKSAKATVYAKFLRALLVTLENTRILQGMKILKANRPIFYYDDIPPLH